MMRTCQLALLLVLGPWVGVTGLPAQNPGDVIAVDITQKHVLTAKRGGPPSTLQVLPTSLTYGPMVNGQGDGSVLLLGGLPTALPRTVVLKVDGNGVNTLSTFTTFPVGFADMGVDDGGDLLVLTRFSGTQNGIYRAPISGASTFSQRVAAWPQGITAEPIAFAPRLDTGDWWVLDQSGAVHLLLQRGGAVLSLMPGAPLTSLQRGDVVEDPLTGDVLVAAGFNVLRLNPTTKAVTTVYRLGVPQGGAEAMGLHFDQFSRGFFFTAWMGFGPAPNALGLVNELNAKATTIVSSTSLGSPRRPERAVAAWGRAFTPGTPPALGTRYQLKLQSRLDAIKPYQVALAFTPRPGIPTTKGLIPLTPDPLFFLSISGVPIFRGFSGVLGLQGTATVAIDIPGVSGLRGVHLVMAAVVFDQTGVLRILGPHGFTVR